MKKEKGKITAGKIIPWVLYAILMGGVITIFCFWKDIYGVIRTTLPDGTIVWDYEPFFILRSTDNGVAKILFEQGIPGFLR